ncbi:MAG TPA: D-2-hydroxyacid dehydrogenase [Dehalococcoidia bacterium]|nr:D-2-hydroxyacid dehydrogenase [Dehalococcoidia bacterium]
MNVVIALGIAPELLERIRAVDGRLKVSVLTRAQRQAYRGGRSLHIVYRESPEPSQEDQEEAHRSLLSLLGEAEVLLSSPIVPPDLPQLAPRLRWLQLTSAGVDRLLESPVLRSGITVTTASGIHAVPIGEYVLGAMLALAKGFPQAMAAQRERAWRPYLPDELHGKTVAIVGLGAIGREVARLAKALGMRVLACRRSCQEPQERPPDAPEVDLLLPPSHLPQLLAEADYLVLAVPLTPETRGLIGRQELASMRQGACLINVARGPVVDEDALVEALRSGHLGGAVLDVFSQEPLPADSDLWGLPNVLLTPHISGGTPRYMERAVDLFCDNLRRYLAGEPLRNVVDPLRGY